MEKTTIKDRPSNLCPIFVNSYKLQSIMPEDRFCIDTESDGSVRKISTVSMLLNAQKYESLFGSTRLTQLASVLSRPASGTPISALKGQMSDRDLADSVKSKYIQGINDMTNYMKSVNAETEALGKDFGSRVRAIQSQQAAAASSASDTNSNT